MTHEIAAVLLAAPRQVPTAGVVGSSAGRCARRKRPRRLLRRSSPVGAAAVDRDMGASLDHLIGGRQQRFRDGEAERLGGLDVDSYFKFRRQLNRQVGRLCATENTIYIERSATKFIFVDWSVGKQTAVSDKIRGRIDRWYVVLGCQEDRCRPMDMQLRTPPAPAAALGRPPDIGRPARHDLKQRGSYVPDFCAVFHAVASELASFSEIESVKKE